MKSKKFYQIGISGHRDLLKEEEDEHISILKDYLLNIQKKHPNQEILVLTPLADGADRRIAKAALQLNFPYKAILPMPKYLYIKDFSHSSKDEFEELLKKAIEIQTIKFYAANTRELVESSPLHRAFQYREAGKMIVDTADEMIFMSDGIKNNKIGGTEDIAEYAQKHGKIIRTIRCKRKCA